MKISEILSRKDGCVRSVEPDAKLEEIVDRFEKFGVGSLVVMEGDEVLGILTETDVVRSYARKGSSLRRERVRSLMGPVLTCSPEDDVVAVSAEMTERRQRYGVVMIGSTLKGIVSIGDVVKCRLAECRLEVAVLRDYARRHGASSAA